MSPPTYGGAPRARGFTLVELPVVSKWKRAAFTLVELLVVIGIIALLIAILMPGLAGARRQAMSMKCAANLRTVGQAMQNYANEFKGRVPRDYWYEQEYREGHILWAEAFAKYVGYRDLPQPPDLTPNRDAVLAPHFGRIEVYQCPAFPNELQVLDYVSNAWHADHPGISGPLVNVTRMPQSGRIVYLAEASAKQPIPTFGIHDVFDIAHLPVTPPPGRTPQNSSRVLTDNRHGGRLNLLFLDGHCESRHFRDVHRRDFDFLYYGN